MIPTVTVTVTKMMILELKVIAILISTVIMIVIVTVIVIVTWIRLVQRTRARWTLWTRFTERAGDTQCHSDSHTDDHLGIKSHRHEHYIFCYNSHCHCHCNTEYTGTDNTGLVGPMDTGDTEHRNMGKGDGGQEERRAGERGQGTGNRATMGTWIRGRGRGG